MTDCVASPQVDFMNFPKFLKKTKLLEMFKLKLIYKRGFALTE